MYYPAPKLRKKLNMGKMSIVSEWTVANSLYERLVSCAYRQKAAKIQSCAGVIFLNVLVN